MHSLQHYAAMEHDELVRLAGEQALLKKEHRTLSAEHQRDKLALRNLIEEIGLRNDWHERGLQLFNRLHEREQRMAGVRQRERELAKLTGID